MNSNILIKSFLGMALIICAIQILLFFYSNKTIIEDNKSILIQEIDASQIDKKNKVSDLSKKIIDGKEIQSSEINDLIEIEVELLKKFDKKAGDIKYKTRMGIPVSKSEYNYMAEKINEMISRLKQNLVNQKKGGLVSIDTSIQ